MGILSNSFSVSLLLNCIRTTVIFIYLVGYEGKEGWCSVSRLALSFRNARSNKHSSTMAYQYAGMFVHVLIRTSVYAYVHNKVDVIIRVLAHIKYETVFGNHFHGFYRIWMSSNFKWRTVIIINRKNYSVIENFVTSNLK